MNRVRDALLNVMGESSAECDRLEEEMRWREVKGPSFEYP